MYSLYDLLPQGKVVEINKSTGLRIGHMLAQQAMDITGAAAHIMTTNGKQYLQNGFIGFQNVLGKVDVVVAGLGVSAAQPYIHFTEEKQGGYSNFLAHYLTPFHDTDIVYPRMIALYPGDIFTTDNFTGTALAGLCSINPATGQLDFAAATTTGAYIFRAELTTLPDGVTDAVQFEYIGIV